MLNYVFTFLSPERGKSNVGADLSKRRQWFSLQKILSYVFTQSFSFYIAIVGFLSLPRTIHQRDTEERERESSPTTAIKFQGTPSSKYRHGFPLSQIFTQVLTLPKASIFVDIHYLWLIFTYIHNKWQLCSNRPMST